MLLLFDIDGTLLTDAAAAHAQALRRALYEVHGIGTPDGRAGGLPAVEAAGRTDLEIAREIALVCEVPAHQFEARRGQLIDTCLREYIRLVPGDLSSKVIPGIRPLLEELAGRRGLILSLLTGNLEGVARVKLDRAGLGHLFVRHQGAFGSDSEDRVDLPPIARGRAGALCGGVPYPRTRTIVIGDTARDIACARADGLRCIAVRTGPLRGAGIDHADAVAESAIQLRELLLEAYALSAS